MTPQLARSTISESVQSGREWLWTWSGACFGYRRENSLFTHDGLEVGHFIGAEVYGADGAYIGELNIAADGPRLITNVYKKSRTSATFVPDAVRPQKPERARGPEPLFIGHEDFPSPDIAKQLGPSQASAAASS
jgi:hypothetical protein